MATKCDADAEGKLATKSTDWLNYSVPRFEPQFVRRELWFLSRNMRAAIGLTNGDISRAMIVMLLARTSVGDWCDAAGVVAEPLAQSYRAAHTVAESFNWPFETVRRQLHRLVKLELCQRGADGFALATSGPHQPRIAQFLTAVRTHLLDFAGGLEADGIAGDVADVANANFIELVRASLDLSLAPIEMNHHAQPDWPKILIYGFVIPLSTRHIVDDRAVWMALGNQIVPDAMRQPVSIAQMAEFLDQPYSSMHRHVMDMARAGILLKRGNGYIIPADPMAAAKITNGTGERLRYTEALLRRLAKWS